MYSENVLFFVSFLRRKTQKKNVYFFNNVLNFRGTISIEKDLTVYKKNVIMPDDSISFHFQTVIDTSALKLAL